MTKLADTAPQKLRIAAQAAVVASAMLVLIGAFAQLYIIIIGGQAYPLLLFPGMDISASVLDSGIAHYVPSVPELLLGIGGIALAIAVIAAALRVLPFIPEQA